MSFLNQYKSGLKVIEAEEIVDLIFFRPIAFVFVKIVYPTNLTPNQITILSMIFGILAGVSISFGTIEHLAIGGGLFAVSCILDCADGQLARLKKNGTQVGRLLDGIVDYISTISIFLGMGFGFAAAFDSQLIWWAIVIITGISFAIQAGLVDFYRSEYIFNVQGDSDFVKSELQEFQKEYKRIENTKGNALKKILLSLYISYSKIQNAKKINENNKNVQPEDYVKNNTLLIRLWNLNGTSTHSFAFIICALLNQLEWFIWYILVFGNIWTIIMLLLQKHSDNKAIKELHAVTQHNKI